MLKSIKLVGVGPADKLHAEFAERVNVLTGDNGLGKSFLLDVAWWALTRSWAGTRALPTRHTKAATITSTLRGKTKQSALSRSEFQFDTQEWPIDEKRPHAPGLVVYARVDGGFSVWDPVRNASNGKTAERPSAYHFDKSTVWDGLDVAGKRVCEGLERDWVSWQRARTKEFEWLESALLALSPPDEPITPGEPRRVFVGEGRDRPTLWMNGAEVPIVLASAGVRRILAIAYLLVWAWREHLLEVDLQLRGEPERRLVLLFDEPENHLHPRWQRSILPSILRAADSLRSEGAETQIVAATHSPLVLASLETSFDERLDAWLDLDLVRADGARHVELQRRSFVRHGDVSSWLTSEAFNLASARSLEAEKVLDEAARALSADDFDKKAAQKLDARLRTVLGELDPFWTRWRFIGEKRGWLSAPKPSALPAPREGTKRGRRS